jgi:hypothetical protein
MNICIFFEIMILKNYLVWPKIMAISIIATLALGSQLKQGFAKVQAMSEAWESHFMLSNV